MKSYEEIDREVEISKSKSTKVTQETNFGLTKGDLMVYNEDLKPKGFGNYPIVTLSAGEDLEKFQYGIVRITIDKGQGILKDEPESYLIQIDGLMAIVYSVYAKNLNDLRKPTIRQKTFQIYGWFRKTFDRIFA